MKVRNPISWFRVWLAGLTAGGSVFALSGYDPEIKATMLDGVQTAVTGLATTAIEAVFITLARDGEEAATTVRAVFEHLDRFFC